jgi:hypothetical protein
VHGKSRLIETEDILRHEFALMTAAHILICLTKEGKSTKDISKDFDNNLELVTVWIDYMTGLN